LERAGDAHARPPIERARGPGALPKLLGDRQRGGLLGVVLAVECFADELGGDALRAEIGGDTNATVAGAAMPSRH
jgi:hypothetical protein